MEHPIVSLLLTCSGDEDAEEEPIALGRATTTSAAASIASAGSITTAVAAGTAAAAATDKFSAPFSTPESSDKGKEITLQTCGN